MTKATTCLAVIWALALGASQRAFADDYVLTGTVATPNTVISDGAVAISGQTIAAVGQRLAIASGLKVIQTSGVILTPSGQAGSLTTLLAGGGHGWECH